MQDVEEKRVRSIMQTQIMECLNRFYAIETGMWGSPLDCLIIRTVTVGEKQQKLYDLSSLAHVLELPLSTVHRKTLELERAGYLKREPNGRSTYLRPSAETRMTLDKSFDDMVATLHHLYRMNPSQLPQEIASSWGDCSGEGQAFDAQQ